MTTVNISCTSEAAERLGISVRRVNQLCAEFGIGTLVSAKSRALTDSDIANLQRILNGIERKGWPRGESRKKT